MQYPHSVRGQSLTRTEVEIIWRNFDVNQFDVGNQQPAKAALLMVLETKIELTELYAKVEALDPQDLHDVSTQYASEVE